MVRTTVAGADDADPLGIGHSHLRDRRHRSLRVGHQLGHEAVVGGLGITEHRHGGAAGHRVASSRRLEMEGTVQTHEALG
jgi:hypothetical protein